MSAPDFPRANLVDRELGYAEFDSQVLRRSPSRTDCFGDLDGELGSPAPSRVFCGGNGFQMGRPYAARHAAEMVDVMPGGDRADLLFVHGSMGIYLSPFQPDDGIAVVALLPFENPAGRDEPPVFDLVVRGVDPQSERPRAMTSGVNGWLTTAASAEGWLHRPNLHHWTP